MYPATRSGGNLGEVQGLGALLPADVAAGVRSSSFSTVYINQDLVILFLMATVDDVDFSQVPR
jgi:hypothetical protein